MSESISDSTTRTSAQVESLSSLRQVIDVDVALDSSCDPTHGVPAGRLPYLFTPRILGLDSAHTWVSLPIAISVIIAFGIKQESH